MGESRQISVEDRRGTRMPFSKGVVAASVTVTGIDPEVAYRLAEGVEAELLERSAGVVGVEELAGLVEERLSDHVGAEQAARWPAWVAARRSGRPILVLIGGATGTGKSTVATRLAGRLQVSKIVSTADVRDVMRASLPESVLPVIHVSSFEADRKLRGSPGEDQDPILTGFGQQAEIVASGVRPLVERAVTEGTDLILEGIHLVPGILATELEQWARVAAVTQMVLSVGDADTHRAHFRTRLEHAKSQRPPRYLARFEAIRHIQRHILLQAGAHRVPVLEVERLDDTVQEATDLVVESVTDRHRADLALGRG